MRTYQSNGKFFPIETGNIFADNYEKNLKSVFVDDFTNENAPFTLTNCATSANGLVCTGFAKAEYEYGTAIDYHKMLATFVYKSGAVFGISMGKTCVYVSGTSLCVATNYTGGTSAPTAAATESITFSLVADEEYYVSLEKRACTCIATVCRVKTNESVSKTISATDTLCLGAPCVLVFAGTSILCKRLAYYAPLFDRARCLIVGDSITEGINNANDPTVRHSWKLMQDYFYGNCVISGVGWATTAGCKARVDKLLSMGYQFDVVMFFSGTNDGNAGYPDTDYYQSVVDEYTAKGIRVIWGIPPMRVNYESSDSMPKVRNYLLAVTGCGFIRFDYATQDANGDPDASCFTDGTHLNSTGYTRCYNFAVNELASLGV